MADTDKVIADPRKFSGYVFKENADHGKDVIFKSLGYTKQHSDILAEIYRKQGAEKFEKKDFVLGKKDCYGQRITIEIVLPGIGEYRAKTVHIRTGWMILADGGIKLLTPFTGFAGR
jgi:filamentous hemagglutinin